MIEIFRARLLLVFAAVFALVIFAVEFPFSQIVHQRAELATLSSQLVAMDSRNGAIQADIASLKRSSTIEAIAHQDYGLVKPGQISYVILPAPSSKTQNGSLALSPVPIGDLVAAPVQSIASSAPAIAPHQSGLFSRFVQRLEFWR